MVRGDSRPRPSSWPIVLGWVAITFGVLGGLAQFFKAFQAWGMSMMPDNVYEEMLSAVEEAGDAEQLEMTRAVMEQQAEILQQMKDLAPVMGLVAIVLMLIAILLFVGGLLLCLRKRVAARVLQVWAVLKMLVGTVGAWFGLKLMAGMFGNYGEIFNSTMTSSGASSGAGVPEMSSIMSTFSSVLFVLNLLWICALPVFVLIWFRRDATREDMEGPGWTPPTEEKIR